MPKYNVLPVTEGYSHSKSRGDILFPKMYQESEDDTGPETRQECMTAQPDTALGLGKPFVLAEQEEEMP